MATSESFQQNRKPLRSHAQPDVGSMASARSTRASTSSSDRDSAATAARAVVTRGSPTSRAPARRTRWCARLRVAAGDAVAASANRRAWQYAATVTGSASSGSISIARVAMANTFRELSQSIFSKTGRACRTISRAARSSGSLRWIRPISAPPMAGTTPHTAPSTTLCRRSNALSSSRRSCRPRDAVLGCPPTTGLLEYAHHPAELYQAQEGSRLRAKWGAQLRAI